MSPVERSDPGHLPTMVGQNFSLLRGHTMPHVPDGERYGIDRTAEEIIDIVRAVLHFHGVTDEDSLGVLRIGLESVMSDFQDSAISTEEMG